MESGNIGCGISEIGIYQHLGKLTVNGGTISGTKRALSVWGGGCVLTINGGTFTNTSNYTVNSAVYLIGGTLNINGGSIEGRPYGIKFAGDITKNININGGTIKGTSWGIMNNTCSVNVKGGTVYGIYTSDGHITNITGGTIKSGLVEGMATVENNNGTVNISGNAVVESESSVAIYNYGSGNINITGGKIKNSKSIGINNESGTVNISGGTFETELNCVTTYAGATTKISGGTLLSNHYCVENSVTITGAPKLKGKKYEICYFDTAYIDLSGATNPSGWRVYNATDARVRLHWAETEDSKSPIRVPENYCFFTNNAYSDLLDAQHIAPIAYYYEHEHIYGGDCDDDCNICGIKREAAANHNMQNGICTVCNSYDPKDITEDGTYKIGTARQLVWFSSYVNGGMYYADAVLSCDIDMSGITDFVPIGQTESYHLANAQETEKGYCGIFDGAGHFVKNLSIKGNDAGGILTHGIFGTVSGTVKNLGAKNFSFSVGSADCRAGAIAGQVLFGGTLENCCAVDSSILTGSKIAGGVAGCNYSGSIKNCYAYNCTVSAYQSRGGFVAGDCRADGGDSDRPGFVDNCYAAKCTYTASNGNATGSVVSTQSVSANITNCAVLSAEDFANGKAANLLGLGFGQNIDNGGEAQSLPVPCGAAVFKYIGGYSNAEFGFVEINTAKKEAKVRVSKDGKYSVMFADYENGFLNKVYTAEITADSKGEFSASPVGAEEYSPNAGDKIMLWGGDFGITPLCGAFEVE